MKKMLMAVLGLVLFSFMSCASMDPQAMNILLGNAAMIAAQATQQRIAQGQQVYNVHPPYATQEEAYAAACIANPYRVGCPQQTLYYQPVSQQSAYRTMDQVNAESQRKTQRTTTSTARMTTSSSTRSTPVAQQFASRSTPLTPEEATAVIKEFCSENPSEPKCKQYGF